MTFLATLLVLLTADLAAFFTLLVILLYVDRLAIAYPFTV
jgi:hypothetical protein